MDFSNTLTSYPLYVVLLAIASVIALAFSALRSARALHMLQLDSYSNTRFLTWLWEEPYSRLAEYRSGVFLAGLLGAHLSLWALKVMYGPYVVLGTWCIAGGLLLLRNKQPKAKKPLAYTARAIRIFTLALLICVTVGGAFGLYAVRELSQGARVSGEYRAAALVLLGGLITIQAAPLLVLLANLTLLPLQSTINSVYILSARRRLKQIAPVVVGITGSYGKTSTKYFLQALLSEHYLVLKTPQSFNTLLGVCRVINDDLRSVHKVFIVEMGAYCRGDIRELSSLVHPQIGVITAIGPQHLERFKTFENIEATKYELIEALPRSGVAVFNNDDQRCRKLADLTSGIKVLRYGLDGSQPGLRIWAEEITYIAQGMSFTLVDSEGNREITRTILLGRHNVLNIVGSACVALEMGLQLAEIAKIIPKIQPAPHRLQLLPGAGGITIIDDSYNSNPLGALEALNVLREFKTGKRVLVTPGMVELGEIEDKENEKFGASAATVCDYVLLVGFRQAQAILRGLEREQFPRERIRVVKNLTEATTELRCLVQAGDVVLFENDLPDLYGET